MLRNTSATLSTGLTLSVETRREALRPSSDSRWPFTLQPGSRVARRRCHSIVVISFKLCQLDFIPISFLYYV